MTDVIADVITSIAERQRWMGTLAKASLPDLEKQVGKLGKLPSYDFLRSPETGLAMVRGKAGGVGDLFNLGEITLTRCVVCIDPIVGFGYVAGRSHRHAELAALCDGLLQQRGWYRLVMASVIEPLTQQQQQAVAQQQRQTASTQVEFFTMRRGE